jgi:hypothetical protein
VTSQYRPHSVHRVVARQSIHSKPRQRIDHPGVAEVDLILHDNMHRRMKRQPRDSAAASTMEGLDKSDTLRLADGEPLGCRWSRFRIVGLPRLGVDSARLTEPNEPCAAPT